MRKMKVWIGEDNFTEINVDDMDLVQRIKSLRNNLNIKKISENDWSLGKLDGARIGFDFSTREVWTIIDNSKVSVNVNSEEYDFLNKIISDSIDEK